MKQQSNNPLLKKLGLDSSDRAVVIHVDDIGMCETTVSSFSEMADFGTVSSGSIMVPCPGFELAADWARNNPHFDLGVHLTLTSQCKTLRWGPINPIDSKYGLVDQDGYLHRTREALWKEASPQHIYLEMKKQVEIALNEGINITHLDAHMFAAMAPHIFPHYITLGKECNKTVFIEREGWQKTDPNRLNLKYISAVEKQNHPIFDRRVSNHLKAPVDDLLDKTKQIIKDLSPGLTYFITHPAEGTDEMKEVTPDWRSRHAEFKAFMNPELKRFIRDSGVVVLSYKDINQFVSDNINQ